MLNQIPFGIIDFLKQILLFRVERCKIKALAAFVRDFVSEQFSVIAALQANVDLLNSDKPSNENNGKRFGVTNRLIERLTKDAKLISEVFHLSINSTKIEKIRLDLMIQEITDETLVEFNSKEARLCSDIAKGTILVCHPDSLRSMVKAIVLIVLNTTQGVEIVRVSAQSGRKKSTVLCFNGNGASGGEFIPWPLGKLRKVPPNGDGIILSGVEAVARCNLGNLSVCDSPEPRAFRLSFGV